MAAMAEPQARALPLLLPLLLLLALVGVASAGAADHKYKTGEPVPLYANKVGPFHNPR